MAGSPGDRSPPPPESVAIPPERLQLAHLLLWTAMSAIVLGTARLKAEGLHEAATVALRIDAVVKSPLFGCGLTAWVLLTWRLVGRFFRGQRFFPTQPGHWLLLILGLYAAADIGTRIIPLDYYLTIFAYAQFGCGGLLVVVACLAAWFSRQPWRLTFWFGLLRIVWQLSIYLLLYSSLSWFPFRLVGIVDPLLLWGFVAAIVIAAVLDWRRGTPRDAWHWTGVGAMVATLVFTFAEPYLLMGLLLMAGEE